MNEYIKKEAAIKALHEVRDEYDDWGAHSEANALLKGIRAIQTIDGLCAEDVMPTSCTVLPIKERARVERALGIIEGATAALRRDERYESIESMLITAVDMIEYVLNKGEYVSDKGE